MNKLILVIFAIILLTIIVIGCAGSSKSNNILTGTIYISGNEPFTHLALKSVDDKFYKIECSDSLEKELWGLQGNVIDLDVVELKEFEKLNIATINGYSLKKDK